MSVGFSNMSLQNRIMISLVFLILLMSFIMIVSLTYIVSNTMTGDMIDRISANSEAITRHIQTLMGNCDRELLQENMDKEQSENARMMYIIALDAQHNVIAHTFPDSAPADIISAHRPADFTYQHVLLTDAGMGKVYDIATSMDYGKGYVRIGFDETDIEHVVSNVIYSIILLGAITVILAIVLSIILTRNIMKPLVKLNEAAKTMGQGDLETKITTGTRDELGSLAHVLDETRQRLKARQEQSIKDRDMLLRSLLNAFTGKFGKVASIVMYRNIEELTKKNPRIIDMIPRHMAKRIERRRREE